MFNINFNLIAADNCFVFVGLFGQGRALSLRYDIKFNLIVAVNNYVFVNLFGGSKPPPYREKSNYSVQNKKAKSSDLAFLELLGRLELPTSSLPRMCSTT